MPRSAGNRYPPVRSAVGISMTIWSLVAMEMEGRRVTMIKLFSLGMVTVELKKRVLQSGP